MEDFWLFESLFPCVFELFVGDLTYYNVHKIIKFPIEVTCAKSWK